MPLVAHRWAGERFSLGFMDDTLANGRSFRTLNIVDDYIRECVAIEMDTSLGASGSRRLEQLREESRKPEMIVLDNGPELTSTALDAWAVRNAVHLCFTAPGKQRQNGFVESFNGTLRDE